MQFAVRYWSSILPDYRRPDGEPRWLDYSLHPASKLGLHNALLTVHDRLEILEQHGGLYECAVFVLESGHEQQLSLTTAQRLFSTLPHGAVKWLDVGTFLVQTVSSRTEKKPAAASPQLALFEHIHTPYDDTPVEEQHAIETDA